MADVARGVAESAADPYTRDKWTRDADAIEAALRELGLGIIPQPPVSEPAPDVEDEFLRA
jgi:hypothetical protein